MAAVISLDRVFRHSGRDLSDPDPSMEPNDVLAHYARQYPRLLGAKVIEPVVEADKLVFTFREGGFGDKG